MLNKDYKSAYLSTEGCVLSMPTLSKAQLLLSKRLLKEALKLVQDARRALAADTLAEERFADILNAIDAEIEWIDRLLGLGVTP
jgi:hypothetical protein